jgi:hypothetical protein
VYWITSTTSCLARQKLQKQLWLFGKFGIIEEQTDKEGSEPGKPRLTGVEMADFRISPVERLIAKPAVLTIRGGVVVLFLVFCCIFYNIFLTSQTFQVEALSVANITPNSGPSTGGQTVQINFQDDLYQRVDGLNFTNPQGTGTVTAAPPQYIDTGITQTGDVKVELQFKIADGNPCTSTGDATGTSAMLIFGARGPVWNTNVLSLSRLSGTAAETIAGNRCAMIIRRGASIEETGNGSVLPMGSNAYDANVHTWTLNGNTTQPTGSWDSTALNTPNLALPNGNPMTMYLGWLHTSSGMPSGTGFNGAVYHLKIWQAGTLVRDMIPVCNAERTSCGLQDKVNYTFYGNIGDGAAFTGGEFLPNEVQSVTFGDAAATDISSPSTAAIQATTPAHTPGAVDVVAVVNGQKVTATDGYTYRPTVSAVSPNFGPTTGGTGFGAAYDSTGQITITGDGFVDYTWGVTPEYIAANTISGWENPQFTSYYSGDPFGGTITYSHRSVGGDHDAWRAFDKVYRSSTTYNWGDSYSSNDPIHTMTWTLPAGKYIHVSNVTTINGQTYRNRGFEVLAGGAAGPNASITGPYQLTDGSLTTNSVSALASAQDLWTNVVTLKVSSIWNTPYTGLQEAYLFGEAVDLTGAGMTSYPTYFSVSQLASPAASAVKIGGSDCVSFTVVSSSEIKCQPAAHSAGIYDVEVTAGGITSAAQVSPSDDDYDYIDPMIITEIAPSAGSEAGGSEVTITGSGFLSTHRAGATQPVVTFDPSGTPANCDPISYTDNQIVCVTSAHSIGLVDVKVDNGLQNYIMNDGFLYYELYIELASSQGGGKVSFAVLPTDATGNSNFDILTAKTNLSTGYQLSMKTAANTLVCSGLDVCSSHWYSSIAASGALSDDSWGRQLNYLANPAEAGQTNPAKPSDDAWQPIPISNTVIYNKTNLDSGVTDAGGDKFRLWYGAKASWFMPVTTYQRTVTITAVSII